MRPHHLLVRLVSIAPLVAALAACAATPDEVASNEPKAPSNGSWPDAGPPKSPPAPTSGSGGSAGAPDQGGAGGTGGEAGTGTPPPPPPDLVPAKNLGISEIAVFQGVKVRIMKDGEVYDPSAVVHPVAGREGIFRIYVEPGAGWTPRAVTARLTLVRPGGQPTTHEATLLVSDASDESDLDTTINVPIPPGAIETDSSYHVELLTKPDEAEGPTTGSRFPATGDAALEAWDTGPVLKVKLVPVDLDGRLPETSAAQLELYETELYSMFPVRKIELSVREPYQYPGNVYAGGSGISTLLGAVTDLRQDDGAPDDVYYYGAFRATDTYANYCYGGCTTGICHLVDTASDTYSRACVGVGYKGPSAAGTMAHELGHAHGLPHAPCGNVAGPDWNYPYSGAVIGAWGWDLRDDTLIDPDVRDFMSYCSPSWISDYNFDRLIHRMHKVALQSDEAPPAGGGQESEWQSAEVLPDGTIVWSRVVKLRRAPLGQPRTIVFERSGADLAKDVARFYPFSDLPGGTLLVPERPEAWDAVRVSNLAGRTVRALRH